MTEDHLLYATSLESTADSRGVRRRDHAIKLTAEALAADPARIADFAYARAQKLADAFDKAHQLRQEDGQLRITEDAYLVVGENERVPVTRATADHARDWMDVQRRTYAREAAAFAAKSATYDRLLPIMVEHGVTLYEAQRIADVEAR